MGEKSSEGTKPKIKLALTGLNVVDAKALDQLRKSKKKNNQSKIDFIQDLLQSQLLDTKHKEKLIKFASDEIRKLEGDHNSVKNDVEVIKKKLREISDAIDGKVDTIKSSNTTKKDSKEQQGSSSKTVHNPQRLVNLLSSFRKNGSALKYSVHSWDLGLEYNDYNSFLGKLEKEYKAISWDLQELKPFLQAKCRTFLLIKEVGNEGWGFDRIKAGWSSPELANWCSENPGRNPFEWPYKFSNPDKDIHFSNFGDVINHFKNEIEVREEGNQLRKLVIDELKRASLLSPSSEFNRPILQNLESKTFYTDVQWFRSAIALIFKEIKKRRDELEECKDITIEALEDKESVVLKIVHYNSFSEGNSIKVNNKLTSIGGDFDSIKDKLMNLCDWSIETKFKEGFFRLNYLCSNSDIPFKEEIDGCKGFTHILKFYKSNL
ncbi:hypothetical protein [Natronogracilivirga saccharolytica]|uniref:Histidine Kinase domain-containing protein n=1 Tax=Natronogracilivirga saccharolytica TaxID=2812953 RepID=A0A8J7RQC7_9BACT|nr:hypothetical protein [Natronogracilivirga saccharolytica]MBP3193999.1 hypothetical protein [Natronogracilivirga saccharolytica]